MTPEHDERFRRIAEDYLERPGGDHAELLRRGRVSSPDGVEPQEWRAEIRAKARADKIRVITIRDGDRAIAARHWSIPKDQELAELADALERTEALRSVEAQAERLGMTPLRADVLLDDPVVVYSISREEWAATSSERAT